MTDFEIEKKRKLDRLLLLRLMDALGMISWKKCDVEYAKQKLRLLHPLSPIWFVVIITFGIFTEGVINTYKELSYSLKNDTVWF